MGGGVLVTCGNGTIEAPEKCDGTNLNGATCASVTMDPGSTGTLTCNANCLGFDTSGCTLVSTKCGNGMLDPGEVCDTTQLNGETCASLLGDPNATGAVTCNPNCLGYNTSACMFGTAGAGGTGTGGAPAGTCGDGVKNGWEQCDGADVGIVTCALALGVPSATGTVACYPNCTLDLTGCSTPPSGSIVCGDNLKDGAEQCDGVDLGIVTCATATGDPTSTGTVSCYPNCTLDVTMCSAPISTGTAGAGGTGGSGTGGTGTGGAGGTCNVAQCQTHVYQCGDCMDNDGDGLVDMDDPDCLGPCDNNEDGFVLNIPGGNNAPCSQDCYFDQDSGSGNDQCYWDHRCDPKEVSPDYYPEGMTCSYDSTYKFPMGLGTCSSLYAQQPTTCGQVCGPLTPNGCDCFGCCELPAGGGNYVWLGSTDPTTGEGSCKLGLENDPTKCHPCTPVQACLNTCQHCELCLGKTTLPADCLPPVVQCGDGKREAPEQCDGMDLGGATCATYTGNPAATGTVSCNPNCTLNGSQCMIPLSVCGNGVKEGSEECDGADLGGATCASLTGDPTATGSVTCNSNCTLNGSMCSIPPGTGGTGGSCGDGIVEVPEQCDGTSFGTPPATCASITGNPNATGSLSCFPNCTIDDSGCTIPQGCGDGIIESPEQCDGANLGGATCASVTGDPNSYGTLGCLSNCTFDTSMCMVPPGGAGGSCGGQVCPVGQQQCGLSCQPPCPTGYFCLTGCCAPDPKP